MPILLGPLELTLQLALDRDSVDLLRFLVHVKQVTLTPDLLVRAQKTMFILPYLTRIFKQHN